MQYILQSCWEKRSSQEPHIAGLAHLEIFLLKDTVRQAALLKRGLRSGITNAQSRTDRL